MSSWLEVVRAVSGCWGALVILVAALTFTGVYDPARDDQVPIDRVWTVWAWYGVQLATCIAFVVWSTVRLKTANRQTLRLVLYLHCTVTFCSLAGCPLSTPKDHYRPPGHLDITIAASPSEEVILFNGPGEGGRDLYVLDLAGSK